MAEETPVAKYARLLLQKAGVGDRLPTPVDEIVATADLLVEQEITLTEVHVDFFTKTFGVLQSALKKAWGMLDFREKVIYLDTTVNVQKQTFVKLHEVGHKVLPWQHNIYTHLDDATTLDPDIKQQFEREANEFASETLFQGKRFDADLNDLPLDLVSPLELARRYGGSVHATIRRYVERHSRACAVLVVEAVPTIECGNTNYRVRACHKSQKFAQRFPSWITPTRIRANTDFAEPMTSTKKGIYPLSKTIQVTDSNGKTIECEVTYNLNSYNVFIFIRPTDQFVKTRVRILNKKNKT